MGVVGGLGVVAFDVERERDMDMLACVCPFDAVGDG